MSASEEILARYRRIERETDSFGRSIGVKKLKPSEQRKLKILTPGLDGSTEVRSDDGKVSHIPDRFEMMVVASVREIEGNPVTFPKSEGELDAVYNALDREGLTAAITAYVRLYDDETAGGGTVEDAKN